MFIFDVLISYMWLCLVGSIVQKITISFFFLFFSRHFIEKRNRAFFPFCVTGIEAWKYEKWQICVGFAVPMKFITKNNKNDWKKGRWMKRDSSGCIHWFNLTDERCKKTYTHEHLFTAGIFAFVWISVEKFHLFLC